MIGKVQPSPNKLPASTVVNISHQSSGNPCNLHISILLTILTKLSFVINVVVPVFLTLFLA